MFLQPSDIKKAKENFTMINKALLDLKEHENHINHIHILPKTIIKTESTKYEGHCPDIELQPLLHSCLNTPLRSVSFCPHLLCDQYWFNKGNQYVFTWIHPISVLHVPVESTVHDQKWEFGRLKCHFIPSSSRWTENHHDWDTMLLFG